MKNNGGLLGFTIHTGEHMNTIIDLFNDHKSERSFTDKAIDDATLDRIISTAWRALLRYIPSRFQRSSRVIH
jgi:hypothetical protein